MIFNVNGKILLFQLLHRVRLISVFCIRLAVVARAPHYDTPRTLRRFLPKKRTTRVLSSIRRLKEGSRISAISDSIFRNFLGPFGILHVIESNIQFHQQSAQT